MKITADHELAIWCLPPDGRWQSEAQLIGQTGLKHRTCGVYAELVRASFCERRHVPILCGLSVSSEAVRMYRCLPFMRRAFGIAWELQHKDEEADRG